MAQKIQGHLVTCSDQSIKQILLHLNTTMHFIIKDLGDHHLFIKSTYVDTMNNALNKILAECMYVKTKEYS